MAQQQPMFVVQSPVASGNGGYKAAAGRSTGVIQIVCGALSIVLGIAILFYSFSVYWEFWGGVVSILGRKKP